MKKHIDPKKLRLDLKTLRALQLDQARGGCFATLACPRTTASVEIKCWSDDLC